MHLCSSASTCPPHFLLQIENPVRVLPMRRFCVGNRAAALSMVRHHGDVQQAIEAGLLAAAAAAAESPTAAFADSKKGHASANGGHHSSGSGVQVGIPLAAPPAAAMERG